MSKKERLIVFSRYPEPGTTKTRLIPRLGPKGAADLQRRMTEHTMSQAKILSTLRDLSVEIRYEGGDEYRMRNWLGSNFVYRSQEIGDLGFRMIRSFEDAFGSGAIKVIIIGTDIPEISYEVIQKAFDSLERKHLVLGPAKDGGYYLIGLQKDSFSHDTLKLFAGINWGERNVLDVTISIAKDLGIRFSLVKELEDVDRPDDLYVWERFNNLRTHDRKPKRISIIIPAINEFDNIKKTIDSVGPQNNKEIIVADGGSRDGTVPLVKSLGAKVVDSSPPRARQMNEGAKEATGNVLLFLHADTRLPKNFDKHVLKNIIQPGIVAGAFELCIDSRLPVMRIIERLANWRSRRLKLPYGDQAIFVLSEIFHQVGGFPYIPIMEDYELVRQLSKKGKIVTLPFPVVTSPRRWINLGILRTTIINQITIALYLVKIPPNLIARWYQRSKGITKKK